MMHSLNVQSCSIDATSCDLDAHSLPTRWDQCKNAYRISYLRLETLLREKAAFCIENPTRSKPNLFCLSARCPPPLSVKTLHIFISSPGDVEEERAKARQVIEQLQTAYTADLVLKPIFWEDLPLGADASFQAGIDLLLSERYTVEIAIFIIWSRLGSPLGPPHRPDGSAYRSGTEREFDFMLEARRRSGGKRPHILAYSRRDEDGFTAALAARKSEEHLRELIDQHGMARDFVREVFHDEQGRNIRAYHTYEKPFTFAARLKTHLRVFLEEACEEIDATALPREMPPYRGLKSFDLEHAPIYFGRENEVCEVELLLRRRAAAGRASAVIVGPSGAGKSSLARAGVAHNLTRENLDDDVKTWRFAVLRPAECSKEGPFRALVQALTASSALPELDFDNVHALAAFEKIVATDPEAGLALALANAFRRADEHENGEVRLLLLVDQLEELWLESSISHDTREAFLRSLSSMAGSGRIWVLTTLRGDLYPLAQQSDAFKDFKRPIREGDDCDGVFELGPPTPASIHRLITEPARRARLRFETNDKPARSLDQDLLRDSVGHPDALPLLEYTLEELFKQRTEHGLLTFAAYDALGGVEGALGKNAGQTLLALSPAARAALDELLPLLVTVDATHAQHTCRRQARLADLTATPSRKELTESLIQARLLATDTRDGEPVAILAHDALLRRWEHLQKRIVQYRELLQLREAVTAAASDWWRVRERHPASANELLLAAGLPLSRGQTALDAGVLEAPDEEFVRASLARAEAAQSAKRRRLQVVTLVSTAAAIILALTAWLATNRTRAVKTLLAASDADRAERLFAENDGAGAVWYLCRAVASGALSPSASERLWFALTQRSWPLPVFEPVTRDAEVSAVSFDPSGKRFAVATRDGAVALFDSATGQPIGAPLPHPRTVRGLQFSPDGTRLLTACDDACARLWDVSKPTASTIGISRHQDVVAGIAWSGDGRRYVTGSWDKRLRVWDSSRPETPVFTVEMKDKVHTVAFDPKSPARVLGVAKDEMVVWDVGTDVPKLRAQGLGDLGGACFSADGSKALSFSEDGDIVLSDLAGEVQPWTQIALQNTDCRQAMFSPNGAMFAVAFGACVRIYATEQPPRMLQEFLFPERVSRLKFTTEGKRLLTACDDGKIKVFDVSDGHVLSEPIVEPGIPVGLDFHPAGNRVLTARSTHTVRLWSLSPPAPLPAAAFGLGSSPLLLQGNREVVCAVTNGKTLALTPPLIPGGDAHARRMDFPTMLVAAASDSTGRIVAGCGDGRVLILQDGHAKEIGKLSSAPVSQLAFSADGQWLAAGDDEGVIGRWTGREFRAMPTGWRHGDRLGGLGLLEPGATLVSASQDRQIALLDTAGGNGPAQHWAINGEPQAFAVDPARHAALVALSNNEVWRVTAAPPAAQVIFRVGNPPSTLAIHPDGKRAAIGTVTGSASLWNLQDGRRLFELNGGDARVNGVCFSPDGRWLGVGTEDGHARVYETATGRAVTEAILHPAAVRHILFAQEGRSLVTATQDGNIFVWPLAQQGDTARAAEIARQVMRDESAGPPFGPRPNLLPALGASDISRLVDELRREGLASKADLLEAYLGP